LTAESNRGTSSKPSISRTVTTSETVSLPNVQIPREVPTSRHRFMDFFKGFENVPAVRETFGNETDKVLASLQVEFFGSKFGYMGVSDEDGHLLASADYLKNGKWRDIYLDVVHELVHVRQFHEGKELFDEAFEYPDRPTELEAYTHTVKEARRLGMTDDEILEYLKVTWLSDPEVKLLAKNVEVNVNVPQKPGRGRRARIT
jgi:hypothetical protein